MNNTFLKVKNLTKKFAGITAVNAINFSINSQQIVGIIGPNGAGKTTLYRLISGELLPDLGSIKLDNRELVGLSPEKIVKVGIARSFQITSVFPNLTVAQNIRVAVISNQKKQLDYWLNLSKDKLLNQQVETIINLIQLEELSHVTVNHLSHGDQALVELGIVFAMQPRLVILDEPTAGMSIKETQKIVQLIKQVKRETKCSFLLTEHNLNVMFELSEILLVMHQGEIIARGTPEEIRNNSQVRQAYLGYKS